MMSDPFLQHNRVKSAWLQQTTSLNLFFRHKYEMLVKGRGLLYIFVINIECAGISDSEIVNDDVLERLRGCTIITSGQIRIGEVPNFK